MDPVTVSTTIARSREDIFNYLSDVANHAEFSDHYLSDWHMLREDSVGRGAGARYRVKAGRDRFSWADMTLAELKPPYRIVARGRGGKFNRIRQVGVFTLSPGAGATTKVEYSFETAPAMLSDRLMESLGARARTRRQLAKAMRRLRSILEENRGRGQRASVAGA